MAGTAALLAAVAGFAPAAGADTESCTRLAQVRRLALELETLGPGRTATPEQEQAADDLVEANDACYLDHRFWNGVLGSLVIQLGAEWSNGVFNASSIGQNAVAELDETEFQHRALIGYSEKPFLRDAYLLWKRSGDASQGPERYRLRRHDWVRWAVLDAFTANALVGFGTSVTPDDDRQRFDTASDLIFEVGISYEVPLERILTPFEE
jgi:hypothetical protein